MTPEQIKAAAAGDREAMEALTEKMMPVIRKMAREVEIKTQGHVLREEVIGAGFLGLKMAAESFDPQAGASFLTFSKLRIFGAMMDQVRKDSKLTRRGAALKRAIDEDRDISEFDRDFVKRTMPIIREVSLDSRAFSRGDQRDPVLVRDVTPDRRLVAAWDAIEAKEMAASFIDSIKSDKRAAALVLCLAHDVPQDQAGKILGISSSRVSQIMADTIRYLRGVYGDRRPWDYKVKTRFTNEDIHRWLETGEGIPEHRDYERVPREQAP